MGTDPAGFRASLAAALLFTGCASMGPETDAPRVTLETEQGDITVEVYPGAAPASAGDFLTYVEQGLYDGAAALCITVTTTASRRSRSCRAG